MQLAFIHGINNEKNTPEKIEEEWWRWIVEGWEGLGLQPKTRPKIKVGYYGKILADAVTGRQPESVAQGGDAASRDIATEFLKVYQGAVGISDEELQQALDDSGLSPNIVEQGRFLEVLLDVASTIETLLPKHGQVIASRFLSQATHYIEDAGLAARIGVVVRKKIFDGHDDPLVVVSHSLGTVVAYKILADKRLADRQVPLFVTLGSPLGIGMMQKILPANKNVPNPPIHQWVNGFRQDDLVTLGRPLAEHTIGISDIQNISKNLIEFPDDKHSIEAYLKSAPICKIIYDRLQ